MRLEQPFNPDGVPEPLNRDVVPAGWYRVMILNDERRETVAGGSFYLWLDVAILDGSYKGRHVFHMINLWNQSEQARDIARQEFASLIRAVGVPGPVQQTEVLHQIAVRAKVRVRKGRGDYPDSNDIAAWEPDRGGTTVQPAPQGGLRPPPQAPAAQPPPPPAEDDFEDDIPF